MTDSAKPGSIEMALAADRIDFTSKATGRDYRLFVSVPSSPPPEGGFPVLYLIDGNLHFGIAVDTARIQGCWPDVVDPVVVGIGYQTDSVAVALGLRMPDLTTPIAQDAQNWGWMKHMPPPELGYGQMDSYLDMLENEIKPMIEERYPIDHGDQTLMGHSLGGLTTLYALFRRTTSFQHYVSISPSIWWNDRDVLKHEANFAERVKSGKASARILVSVGEMETGDQRIKGSKMPMTAEQFAAMDADCRMVPNTVELGERLMAIVSDNFEAMCVVHEGDDHNMVPPAGIARGVKFAFRRPD